MSRFDSLLVIPSESAPGATFRAMLLGGVTLFAVVAIAGRSHVTMGAVVLYLLSLPTYVAARAWREDRTGENEDDGSDGEHA